MAKYKYKNVDEFMKNNHDSPLKREFIDDKEITSMLRTIRPSYF